MIFSLTFFFIHILTYIYLSTQRERERERERDLNENVYIPYTFDGKMSTLTLNKDFVVSVRLWRFGGTYTIRDTYTIDGAGRTLTGISKFCEIQFTAPFFLERERERERERENLREKKVERVIHIGEDIYI